ncbi:MAG: hypothetical protein HN737_08005 [Desulfobacterales bacterium]|nr:hypothetical protein [Desulfobacteraceae bacterium]MBT7086755.1 hypothetical protein [Desulfobacterales bacterium]MBT7697338.1 hypothetical protein [Desulfobacterales bacterium]
MDNNLIKDDDLFNQFDVIEEKIENLIEINRKMEEENSSLNSKVVRLENELREKTEAEIVYKEQKVQVNLKIDSLLNKLNNFQ